MSFSSRPDSEDRARHAHPRRSRTRDEGLEEAVLVPRASTVIRLFPSPIDSPPALVPRAPVHVDRGSWPRLVLPRRVRVRPLALRLA